MSMIALLKKWYQCDAGVPFLIDAGTTGHRIVTRGEFWRRVQALNVDLASRGVGADCCVAVWLPNWSDSLVWQFAAVSLGAHVIGINTRYNVEEATHVLDLARPAVVAVAHGFIGLNLNERLAIAVSQTTAPKPSVAVVAGPHRQPPSQDELGFYDVGAGAWAPSELSDQKSADVMLNDDPSRLAVAFTTSGSTGRPKLAGHKVSAVAHHAIACAKAGGWTPESVFLVALPLTGVFSFVPTMSTIAAGGVCLLEPYFDPEIIVDHMATFGATHVVAGDDVVGRLVDVARVRPRNLSRWRRLLIGDFNGRSQEVSKWAEGNIGLTAAGCYGSSELFALTAFWPNEEPAPERWCGGGRPVSKDISVRTGDPETGEALSPGAAGELQFRGPNVVDAYLGDPDRMSSVLTCDGWFRSGDLGSVRQDGSFEYICRIGDVLRLKGFLVEPAEIERRLAAHEAVSLTKVVGIRDGAGETRAVAFVTLRDGFHVPADDLVAWCAKTLARYKVPRDIYIVEEMPVTPGVNGAKIRASVLREWALERTAMKGQ